MSTTTATPVAAGTVPCLRCGYPCVVSTTSNPDARLLRAATTPQGVCPSCHVTAFLQDDTLPIATILRERGPEVLRMPHVAEQFVAIAKAAGADVPAHMIDWERVIANWALPHPKAKTGGGK